MSFSQLRWDETFGKYKEENTAIELYEELFPSICYKNQHVACILLSTPSALHIREEHHAVLALRECYRNICNETSSEGGANVEGIDCYDTDELVILMLKITNRLIGIRDLDQSCSTALNNLNYEFIGNRNQNLDTFLDKAGAITLQSANPAQAYIVRLIGISEKAYERIKLCKKELPRFVQAVLRFTPVTTKQQLFEFIKSTIEKPIDEFRLYNKNEEVENYSFSWQMDAEIDYKSQQIEDLDKQKESSVKERGGRRHG